MRARNIGRIVLIKMILSTFVLYLCTSVSKVEPLFLISALIVSFSACMLPQFSPFSAIVRYTQKRE